MEVKITVNGRPLKREISPDLMLIDFLRNNGYTSVKRGCETSNCGLCTVHLNGIPVLSCSTLALRADGHNVTTLEGMQEKAKEIGGFIADEGAEQCGYCSPGFIMNIIAMENEWKSENKTSASEHEILSYLSGNLCRCTGYMGHLRALKKYFASQGIEITPKLEYTDDYTGKVK
ncbi:MAG: 2Fe-2S iron-sulfur cluster-binding protein [Proteocatella sp.]